MNEASELIAALVGALCEQHGWTEQKALERLADYFALLAAPIAA